MENSYNPDVLNCIASLSNDEVFTSPSLANQVLDLLPQELFSNPAAKFLDPFTKSGVFLREIVKRLDNGLKHILPDRRERIDHIMHEQVYGIACTELTALLSRRSVYCSKTADGKYSVSRFDSSQGNILYSDCRHSWSGPKCRFCGANREAYDRGGESEQYAYPFIHTDNPLQLIENMTFDVIIGNPPYQMSDGGGRESSAAPLYHLFVQQALKLKPHYLCMIIPARWYSGGKGLDAFRTAMIGDKSMRVLHDFPETKDCFPGLNIRGGVCYFLWDRDYYGKRRIYSHIKDSVECSERYLREGDSDVFIRYNRAIQILHKVELLKEKTLGDVVSSRKPFGLDSNFDGFSAKRDETRHIKLYRIGKCGYIDTGCVLKNRELIGRYKVIVSKASPGGDEYPHMIISQPILAEPYSVCTETYLVVKDVASEEEGLNLISYMKTRFFRFMMSLVKNTQNISKGCFAFVPLQDFSHPWTDGMLYDKYGIGKDEIDFIDSMIRPME